MLSQTLRQGLKSYGVGPRIRAMRLKKKLGLVELGRHSGLSAAMISRIERGRLFPTLPTLLKLALVFDVGLDVFFAGARDKPVVGVVRRNERLRFPEKPGTAAIAYRFESLDFTAPERRLHAYLAEFVATAHDPRRFHQHPGGEFIYAMRGTLSVRIGDDEHTLGGGDSMYFDASAPHGYARGGRGRCQALVVVSA